MPLKDYNQLSDVDLIELLNGGCEKAFNEIYRRYWASVFLVAKNRVKDNDLAEEIVQNIFFNFWKRRTSFKLQQNLKTYFAVVVKYEVINYFAKEQKAQAYVNWQKLVQNNEDYSTEITIQFNELKKSIEESLCLLPDRCQLVFKLRVEKGFSQKQIAEELDISEKTVEAHLHKARVHLRSKLGHSFSITLFLLLLER